MRDYIPTDAVWKITFKDLQAGARYYLGRELTQAELERLVDRVFEFFEDAYCERDESFYEEFK